MSGLGIWVVRAEAASLGESLARKLVGTVYRAWESAGPQKTLFEEHFTSRSHWVLIMAAGIATRFMSGLLRDKYTDPAVVVLDEAARYAIPLLGGHEGGANELAYGVAAATGAVPVITTATEALKPLVVGIGCRKGVSEEQIERAVLRALGDRPLERVRELATVDLKANEIGLLAFAQRYQLPLRILRKEQLEARAWVSRPSEWVREAIGLDGVCEPCALLASVRGRLVVPKTTLEGVAVAVVEDGEWGG